MIRLFLLAVVLLALAGGSAYWALARDDDGAEAKTQVWRWVNVTVEVPEDSGLTVSRELAGVDTPHPFLVIQPISKSESLIAIDALTGEIARDTTQPEDKVVINPVLQTVAVSPFDPNTLPWPYNGDPPNVPRQRQGKITYIRPDPAAGININLVISDPGGAEAIEVHNGRSFFFIYAETGKVVPPTRVMAEDKEAFDRFLAALTVER